ncbi:MAG: hypothetical protein EA422_05285 [Gemmatimonadales bacterium]|nr:MAG: hypothetical protein EA422_05285 [Gemmatimonadales bacterium]
MSQSGAAKEGHTPAPEDLTILRAKYLDFCSARVADTLLRLSADEIYVLAEKAARASGEGEGRDFSFDTVVKLATARLTEQLALPPFEIWVAAYREDPTGFDGELLGLWESAFNPESEGSGG